MLTPEQLLHFNTFGFVVLRGLLQPREVETIRGEFARRLAAAYPEEPFNGTRRHWATTMGPDTPLMRSLLEDERFASAAEQMYGPDTFGVITDANRYVGDTAWHPDTRSRHQYGVKFAYYLDPVGAGSGALRVIPGSHRNPLHDELRETLGKLRLPIQDVPACVCESRPGDVVAFDLRTWHASSGGSNDRPMCTVVFYNYPKNADEERETRIQGKDNYKITASFKPGLKPFDDDWVANRERNARRQRYIEALRGLGFFEPAA